MIKQFSLTALIVATAYAVSFLVVAALFMPLQEQVLGNALYGSLIFLPHGVRVIAIALYRLPGVIGVIIGSVKVTIAVAVLNGDEIYLTTALLLALSNALVPWITIKIIGAGGVDISSELLKKSAWRFLLLVGLVSSVGTSLLTIVIPNWLAQSELITPSFQQLAFISLGDTLGVLALFGFLLFWRKTASP